MFLPTLVRRTTAMAQARREASARGDRALRESSTFQAAAEVWSDVASSRGLGFRSEDDGPVLHGDLRAGGAFEMGVCAMEAGYATLAGVRLTAPLGGRLSVRPHEPWTRVLTRIVRPPAMLTPVLTTSFYVRAKPVEVASTVLTPKIQALLALFSDRLPQLHARDEEVLLVLEGIELAHERIEAIVDAFETLFPLESGPYRR